MTMMKRPSPLLESPQSNASSSDDDEQLEDVVVKENIEDEEAEEEEYEDDDDESIFIVKKHVVVSTPAQPRSSSSSMGEEEESNSKSARSDSDLPVPPPPPENTTTKSSNNITDVDPSVKKPITSIPMFPRSAKRVLYEAADNKPVEGEVSKRRKKKNGVDDGEVSEMKSSNKLWIKDDEVVILKGLLSLIKKHGVAKPTSELINELHENVKALLQAEVTNEQLYGKIRKLKQKYSKGTINDSKVDELAKKIWGGTSEKEVDFKVREEEMTATDEQAISGGGVDSAAPAKKEPKKNTTRSRRSSSKASKTVVSPQQQLPLPSFFNEIIESGKNSIVPPEGLKRFLAKEMLGFIQGSKAKDLEDKWNKLQIAEAKIYLDRIDLVKEQVELLLDAFGTEEE